MNTLFFRLLQHEDKAAGLSEALDAVRQGHVRKSVVHVVDPASFRQVPGSPFAYWVSEHIRRLFTELQPLEGEGRTVRVGLQTSDDFRFVRAWWEVSPARILDGGNGPAWQDELEIFQAWCRQRTFEGKRWVPFAKGGAYSPYYADLHLVVNWERDGEEMKAWADPLYGNSGWSRIIKSVDYYFRPGLTWPLRGIIFSAQAVPAGSVFSVAGKMALVQPSQLSLYMAIFNTRIFNFLIGFFAGKVGGVQYEAGLIGKISTPRQIELSIVESAHHAWLIKYNIDTTDETSHVFCMPALLQVFGNTLVEMVQHWTARITEMVDKLAVLKDQIDGIAYKLYAIAESDQWTMYDLVTAVDPIADWEENEESTKMESVSSFNPRGLVTDLLAYAVGLMLGRWDIRYVTRHNSCLELAEPFAPLPVCSPGMLVQADGLPAGPQDVPGDYPLRISWTGVLVDDEGHPEDISGRVRQVLEVLWPERTSEIEHEACDLLGVRSLRDYFTRPNNFFAEHLKRYSKSRRQAPIYWPLQTPSGSYTVWLYYPRLTDQTLYTCVNDVVEPKLTQITEQLNALRIKTNRSNQEERELERLLDFEQELKDFRDELLRVAAFWKPDLNDGVQITAAPLWRLFQHKAWQKKLKDTWTKLEKGDYDWAHLAYSIWPDRVRATCKHDKSLAIAHGLEDLYEVPPAPARKKSGRRRMPTG